MRSLRWGSSSSGEGGSLGLVRTSRIESLGFCGGDRLVVQSAEEWRILGWPSSTELERGEGSVVPQPAAARWRSSVQIGVLEGHINQRPENQQDVVARSVAWFRRHDPTRRAE